MHLLLKVSCSLMLILLLFQVSDGGQSTLQAYPVVLVPGDGGSQIEGKIDKPSVVHYVCSKKTDYWFSLWLNMELLVPIVIDCWVDNMKLVYNNASRTTFNQPGVLTRVPDFGNSSSVEWIDPSKASAGNYFASISSAILKFGYERNVSLRGAPYDFRKAPNEMKEYFVNLKILVEDTFTKTSQRTIFVTHSMGSPMTLYFLNQQTQAWKDKYIKSWISLGGCWAGTVKALKVYAQGDNLGVRVLSETALREQQRTSPSLSWLMPSDKLWRPDEVIVQTSTRNYTIRDYQDFFLDINFPTAYDYWQDTRPLVHDLVAPGVELHCLFGTGVDTAERLVYDKTTPLGKATIIMGDGDGTVNVRSLSACAKWADEQKQPVVVQPFPKRDHMGVLNDPDILSYIQNVVAMS